MDQQGDNSSSRAQAVSMEGSTTLDKEDWLLQDSIELQALREDHCTLQDEHNVMNGLMLRTLRERDKARQEVQRLCEGQRTEPVDEGPLLDALYCVNAENEALQEKLAAKTTALKRVETHLECAQREIATLKAQLGKSRPEELVPTVFTHWDNDIEAKRERALALERYRKKKQQIEDAERRYEEHCWTESPLTPDDLHNVHNDPRRHHTPFNLPPRVGTNSRLGYY
jgi:chromosome segregation ATPase